METPRTHITLAQPGFSGRRAKWRIARSSGPWDPTTDARSALYRSETREGRANVEYVRGPRPENS